MIAALTRWIAAQSPEEIARQERVLADVETVRILLTIFAYLVAAIYVDLALCLAFAAVDTAAEWGGLRLIRNLNPARQPWRYLAAHGSVIVAEACFAIPAAMIWQMGDPFARAMTVGMVAITLLQLIAVRCIHLPFAITGWATVLVISLVSNAWLWLGADAWQGLLVSSAVALATGLFTLQIMVANHAMHDDIARERSAAMAADRAKSLFLAQMSHELRTPLNAIIGMGSIEMAQSSSADTRARMATLVQSARGLSTILDDILDVAAAGEGRLALRPADLDLRAEIAVTVALFRPLAEAQGLEIEMVHEPGLPERARFDGHRLRQCLSNILSNAVKHTEAGRIRVRVQAVSGLAAVTISDTGPGIPPSVAARLFEPFRQGPDARGGTGLGLAISRQIARAMGGDLVLMPQVRGARFRLTFRLDPASQAGLPQDADSAAGAGGLAGMQVLVVDDIATNRLVAASFLRHLGAVPVEAANAREALARIAAASPDAVLLDMNMPEIDGIETFRRICQDAALRGEPRPPVVAMTADATEAHRRAYLGAGLDDYLAKPLDPEALLAVLSRLIRRPGR